MNIITERLVITEFDMSMAQAVHVCSLDADNRRFLPDEVFETAEEAAQTLCLLIGCYASGDGPQAYAVLTKEGAYIGHVQAVPMDGGWEAGYHVSGAYAGNGYATEAVAAFLPAVMTRLGISEIAGVCLAENRASARVMEKCGFEKLYEGEGVYQGRAQDICRYVYRAQKI